MARIGNGSLRVLLATDQTEGTKALSSQLEREGCAVIAVSSGSEALNEAAGPYDLIFLDLELPDTDGLTVLKQLRSDERSASTPVVLLKGEGEPAHTVQRGLDLGASGYLVKQRLRSHVFKNSLVDPDWANLEGDVTADFEVVSKADVPAGLRQERYYRVLLIE